MNFVSKRRRRQAAKIKPFLKARQSTPLGLGVGLALPNDLLQPARKQSTDRNPFPGREYLCLPKETGVQLESDISFHTQSTQFVQSTIICARMPLLSRRQLSCLLKDIHHHFFRQLAGVGVL